MQSLAGKLAEAYRHNQEFDYDIPQALIAVWLACGPDFQLLHDIQSDRGLDSLVYWWLTAGRGTFEGLADVIDRNLAEQLHLNPMRGGARDGRLIVTPLLRLVLRHRADLSAFFDVKTQDGLSDLWCWWLEHGQHEYLKAPEWFMQAQTALLHESPAGLDEIAAGLPLTPLLRLIWKHNADLRAGISLDTLQGRESLWLHFLTTEVGALSLPYAGMPSTPNLKHPKIPDPVLLVYGTRADLRRVFDIGKPEGVEGLLHWWLQGGCVYSTLWKHSLPELTGLFDQPDDIDSALMPLLVLIARQRQDLHLPDPDTQDGRGRLLNWWLLDGWRLYPAVAKRARLALTEALHLNWLPAMARAGRLGLTPLLRVVLQARPDVASVVEDGSDAGIRRVWWWWLTEGQRCYLGAPGWLAVAQVRWLHCCEGMDFGSTGVIQPTLLMDIVTDIVLGLSPDKAGSVPDLWAATIQKAAILGLPDDGMPYFNSSVASGLKTGAAQGFEPLFADYAAIIHMVRADIAQAFDLTQPDGLRGLIDWYLQFAIQGYPRLADPLGAGPRAALGRPMPGSHAALDIPAIGWLFALSRAAGDPVVQGADDAPAQEAWWNRAGKAKYRTIPADVLVPVGEKSALAPQGGAASAEAESDLAISLVGYPRGEFGLGEDIRLLRASMQSVEINPTVVRAPWTIIARQGADEPSIEAALAEFGTDVMFYVMPAFDTATLLAKVGVRAFSARRRIGFWQWELEHFPEPAKVAMELVDEIWCHSEHSARAFREATDKPVIKVPLPVAVPEVCSVDRAEFDLPDDGFVVFTSFDGASSISRKNPLGAILAFQRAFPAHEHPQARLVIKAMNTLPDSLWHECLRKAVIDPRILIRNEVMDRARYYELLKACDAVISLHRAEGFGRLMAEAMGLGIPVIATAYSGNMDFMTEENSWLVGGDMVPVFAGDYAFYSGQRWMEPDIAIAARALRECADNSVMRDAKVAAARKTIAQYSPSRCGEVYKTLLAGG
ncbi:MAG: glycosyltransferase [Acetobacter papayae]